MKTLLSVILLLLVSATFAFASPDTSSFSSSFSPSTDTLTSISDLFISAWNQFVLDFQSSTLYGSVNSSGNFLSSDSDPEMFIEGGLTFGSHIFSFSNFDSLGIFTVLKSIFILISSFSAFKIAAKGGSQ